LQVVHNHAAIYSLMQELPAAVRTHPTIAFAMAVRTALTDVNYHQFFARYRTVPFPTAQGGGGQALMGLLLGAMRYKALLVMARAYKPGKIPTSFVQK
jgi:hypothetical protein